MSATARGAACQRADAGPVGAACRVSAVGGQHDGGWPHDGAGARDAGADCGGVRGCAGSIPQNSWHNGGRAGRCGPLYGSGMSVECSVRGERRVGLLAAAAARAGGTALFVLRGSAVERLRQVWCAGWGWRLLPGLRYAAGAATGHPARGQRSLGDGTSPPDRGVARVAVVFAAAKTMEWWNIGMLECWVNRAWSWEGRGPLRPPGRAGPTDPPQRGARLTHRASRTGPNGSPVIPPRLLRFSGWRGHESSATHRSLAYGAV